MEESFDASSYGYQERWAVTNIVYLGYCKTAFKSKYSDTPLKYHRFLVQMYGQTASMNKRSRSHTFSLTKAQEVQDFFSAIGVSKLPDLIEVDKMQKFFYDLDKYVARVRPHIMFGYEKKDDHHWKMTDIRRCHDNIKMPGIWHGLDDTAKAYINSRGVVYEEEDTQKEAKSLSTCTTTRAGDGISIPTVRLDEKPVGYFAQHYTGSDEDQ